MSVCGKLLWWSRLFSPLEGHWLSEEGEDDPLLWLSKEEEEEEEDDMGDEDEEEEDRPLSLTPVGQNMGICFAMNFGSL